LGDWQGTFTGEGKKGHKGAVWEARLARDASLAVTSSADFSAYVFKLCFHPLELFGLELMESF